MCRLFLGFHIDADIYIKKFFRQSHCKYRKKTPGITNYRDNGPHTEGFGFAFLDKKRWVIYKSPKTLDFEADRTFPSNLVIGHIRKLCDKTAVSIENTHPFVYGDHVFFHNGRIHDFASVRPMILSWIHPMFRQCIRGETDTECLFYFYLTIAKTTSCEKDAFCILFETFRTYDIELSANFIYGNPFRVFVTRFLYYNLGKYTKRQYAHSLYYDANVDNGFIISSEPVSGHPRMVEENSIIEIDIGLGEVRLHKI